MIFVLYNTFMKTSYVQVKASKLMAEAMQKQQM